MASFWRYLGMSHTVTKTVLLVEDDDALRYATCKELEAAGYRVVAAEGTMRALDIADAECPDIVVTDIRFPPGQPHGLALGRMLRARHVSLPVIYVTGYPELVNAELDIGTVLAKPAEPGALVAAIRDALANT
jgi:DNA-binding NtrC family response regulator